MGRHGGRDAAKKADPLQGHSDLNPEEEEIFQWLRDTKFRKVAFGGVSEADVWKKISELNDRYDAAFRAQQARFDALLAEREGQAGLRSSHG